MPALGLALGTVVLYYSSPLYTVQLLLRLDKSRRDLLGESSMPRQPQQPVLTPIDTRSILCSNTAVVRLRRRLCCLQL